MSDEAEHRLTRRAEEETERLRKAGDALADAIHDIVLVDDSTSALWGWVRNWREVSNHSRRPRKQQP